MPSSSLDGHGWQSRPGWSGLGERREQGQPAANVVNPWAYPSETGNAAYDGRG
jgi:hypothetical protein